MQHNARLLVDRFSNGVCRIFQLQLRLLRTTAVTAASQAHVPLKRTRSSRQLCSRVSNCDAHTNRTASGTSEQRTHNSAPYVFDDFQNDVAGADALSALDHTKLHLYFFVERIVFFLFLFFFAAHQALFLDLIVHILQQNSQTVVRAISSYHAVLVDRQVFAVHNVVDLVFGQKLGRHHPRRVFNDLNSNASRNIATSTSKSEQRYFVNPLNAIATKEREKTIIQNEQPAGRKPCNDAATPRVAGKKDKQQQ